MNRLLCPVLLVGLLAGQPAVRGGDAPARENQSPGKAADQPAKVTSIEGITEYRLPNGLRILLMPDASKPLVHVQCNVLVGSRHEGYGEAGMAHLLEHMLFKGTPTHPNIAKTLRDSGARYSADTAYDRTRYYETLPASDDNLEFAIRLEADRLVNTVIRRDQLLTEMTVVRNEFERKEDHPEHVLAERIQHAAFEWHNYGKTVYGNRSDIERVPADNLRAFYRKHYRVDNAVLIVTGRFDEAKALELVRKYFGPLKPPADRLLPTYTQEPPQDGERTVTLRRAGSHGAVGVAYHIPAGSHPDFPALQVLAACLTEQPAGRLYRSLVETKKATAASASALAMHDPALLVADAIVDDPAGIDAAREALVATFEAVVTRPVTDEEVERARHQYASAFERVQADAESMAHLLVEYVALGDWRLFFLDRDRMAKVTAADVNRVARVYLIRDNRTVGTYYPTPKPERVHVPDAPDLAGQLDAYAGRAAGAATETFEPTPENIERRVVRGRLGPARTAFLVKPTRGEQVTVELVLPFGNEKSLAGEKTAAAFLGDMLAKGTKAHTRQQFIDELVRLGAGLSVDGRAGALTVSLSVKAANLPAALGLVAEMLREPAFPPAEFETMKAQALAALSAPETNPAALAADALFRRLEDYSKDDIRYRSTRAERAEQVRRLTIADVRTLYEMQLGAQDGILAVVGNFDPRAVEAALRPALEGWEARVPYRRIAIDARPLGKGERVVIDTPEKANAEFWAGTAFPMADTDPDYPALLVGADILGGNTMVSRLGKRIRTDSGLSYGINAGMSTAPLDRQTTFVITGSTNPANMPKLAALVSEELARFLKDGVTPDELAAAKRSAAEGVKMALADDAVLADLLASGLLYGRTVELVATRLVAMEALTPEDVRKAFARRIDPAKLVIVEAGDFRKK
jgi:zinc protease